MNERSYKLTQTESSVAAPEASSPFAIIWMFAAIVLALLMLANFSFGLLSSVRAYVGGESLWSKAQKDAVYHLQKYAASRAPEELRQFRADVAVLVGDHEARVEMDRPNPDIEIVQQGFIRGGNHIDDVDGMFKLYRRFGWVGFMQRAIRAWDAGDRYIVQLDQAGTLLQRELESPSPRAEKVQSILGEIFVINEKLAPIENQFVDALSEASRTTYRSLQGVMLATTPGLLLLGIVLSLRILRHRKRAEDWLNHIAFHDDLTSLPNRLLLNQRLEQALSRHHRTGLQLAILFLDLNRFKVINDSLGHEVGDVLLRQVADRLRAQSREGDTVARVGGDKFAVLTENHENLMGISTFSQRLVESLSAPYVLGRKDCHVTLSIGISVFPSDGNDSQALLKAADVAMYRAKSAGRNNYLFYSPSMNVHTVERLELESDLSHALERGEFLLHYQPKVETMTGLITGTEALLRWKHPLRGLVPPIEFIPLAEETGLIVPIGEWVLATACAQNKAWQDRGLTELSVAVNLSVRQFADPLLLLKLTRIIHASGLDPSSLELEITESMVMSHGDCAVAVLEKLKSIGVQIAIDDFGTGYSSLAYLKRFPIDTLKVDRSFIRDIPADSGGKKITRAIIAMAHSLKLKVVAEGVETADQLKFLRAQRCDAVQGYFLYRPLPEEEMTGVLDLNRLDSVARLAIHA
ncbi:MAG TPA: EAL domain-containing protein [Steroidobacteraceae bacterium]|nr:EAL domain-containing protein [Steroidobacteraceae bacterium]